MSLQESRLTRALKLGVAALLSMAPLSILRVLLYRLFFGYRISLGARIGFLCVIAVEKATIGRARIARFNTFRGPADLTIEDGATIGPRNAFECGYMPYERRCRIGRNVMITQQHYIDVSGGFDLGDNSWLAGRGSQFWTHGVGIADHSVSIGADCYISSAVRFAPGSSVGDRCLVALGSVVVGKFTTSHVLLAGVPAKIVMENYDWGSRE